MGQEGPHAWARLPFGDVKGTFIGPREGGTVVVDVVEVHQHLWMRGEGGEGGEWRGDQLRARCRMGELGEPQRDSTTKYFPNTSGLAHPTPET